MQGSINVLIRIIAAFVNWTSGSVNTFLNVVVMAIMHWKLCSDFLCTCKACATFVLDMLVLWLRLLLLLSGNVEINPGPVKCQSCLTDA